MTSALDEITALIAAWLATCTIALILPVYTSAFLLIALLLVLPLAGILYAIDIYQTFRPRSKPKPRDLSLIPRAVESNRSNHFLNLLGELRNQVMFITDIYEHSLYVGEVWIAEYKKLTTPLEEPLQIAVTFLEGFEAPKPSNVLSRLNKTKVAPPPTPSSVLLLPRTCRQIHNEATSIFYSVNSLNIRNYNRLRLVKHLRPQVQKAFIQELAVHIDYGEATEILDVLSMLCHLENVQVVHIRCAKHILRSDSGSQLLDKEKQSIHHHIRRLLHIRKITLPPCRDAGHTERLSKIQGEMQAAIGAQELVRNKFCSYAGAGSLQDIEHYYERSQRRWLESLRNSSD